MKLHWNRPALSLPCMMPTVMILCFYWYVTLCLYKPLGRRVNVGNLSGQSPTAEPTLETRCGVFFSAGFWFPQKGSGAVTTSVMATPKPRIDADNHQIQQTTSISLVEYTVFHPCKAAVNQTSAVVNSSASIPRNNGTSPLRPAPRQHHARQQGVGRMRLAARAQGTYITASVPQTRVSPS